MRKMTLAAGLLMMSGSTVAMAQDYMSKPTADMSKTASYGGYDAKSLGMSKDMGLTKASYDTGWTDTGAKFASGYDTKTMGAAWAKDLSWSGDKDMALSAGTMDGSKTAAGEKTMLSYKQGSMDAAKLASWDDGSAKMSLASGDLSYEQMAMADKMAMMENDALVDMAATADRSATGMGGPYEPVTAQTDYPPCSATVTDSCIQLYERGVRDSYAAWQAQRGTQLAQGGPYEPVPSDMAMTTTPTGGTYEPVTETAWSQVPADDAVGGPFEPVEEHADAGMMEAETNENTL